MNNNNNNNQKPKRSKARDIGFYILLAVILIAIIFTINGENSANKVESYAKLYDLFDNERVESFKTEGQRIILQVRDEKDPKILSEQTYDLYSFSVFYEDFNELIMDQYQSGIIKDFDYTEGFVLPWWASFIPYLLIIVITMAIWYFMMNKAGGGGGFGGIAKFSQARTKNGKDEKNKKTFRDVAGCEEEKAELAEVVDFLKDPKQYTAAGARIPKGILLVGPPGTGKTLLAKAVAGEANVEFLSISGSDFVELYVGVGAGRVRDLFEQAKKIAPAIIFIDEIDAVGRQRGSGLGGGHDEREQTLNQLLVEMDGFGNNEGVIVIAATNRADILDNALLRPGRFDRQIYVGLPDIRGREQILKIHARDKHLAEDVDLNSIAKGTPGFSGADLENLMNEAAILSVRRKERFICQEDIDEAILKVQIGPEKKSRKMSDKARKLTAYHESGHAIAGHFLEHTDPVHYITIIPRGAAGGFTLFRPEEDLENFKSKAEMYESIVMALGGRVAEKLFLDDISTGASADIQQASETARNMIMKYGMSEKLGPISYDTSGHSIFIGRDFGQTKSYSEETAAIIDEEVKRIFDQATADCEKILLEHREQLEKLAQYLLENETIEADNFNHFFETGEFLPKNYKDSLKAALDPTIERPARKIAMFDDAASGIADEAEAKAPEAAAEAPAAPEEQPESTEEAKPEENSDDIPDQNS